MTLRQFLSMLRARWWVALMLFLLTVGTTIGITLMLPKQYTATATLVVDQSRPDPVAAAMYSGNPSPAFMATQVDVLKSDRIALHVVNTLRLADDPKAREDWMQRAGGRGVSNPGWCKVFRLSLDVKPSRESNVISVAFKASDPVKAATLANAFVQAYMDISLKLKVDPAKQYSTFFDSRSKELRANVERAQAKLSAYQRETGVVIASDGQLDVEAARLNELSSQLVALQAVAAESSSRQAQAQAGAADRLQEVINNPVVSEPAWRYHAGRSAFAGTHLATGRQPSTGRRSEGEHCLVAQSARYRDAARDGEPRGHQQHQSPARGRDSRGARGAARQGIAPAGGARGRGRPHPRSRKRPARLRRSACTFEPDQPREPDDARAALTCLQRRCRRSNPLRRRSCSISCCRS